MARQAYCRAGSDSSPPTTLMYSGLRGIRPWRRNSAMLASSVKTAAPEPQGRSATNTVPPEKTFANASATPASSSRGSRNPSWTRADEPLKLHAKWSSVSSLLRPPIFPPGTGCSAFSWRPACCSKCLQALSSVGARRRHFVSACQSVSGISAGFISRAISSNHPRRSALRSCAEVRPARWRRIRPGSQAAAQWDMALPRPRIRQQLRLRNHLRNRLRLLVRRVLVGRQQHFHHGHHPCPRILPVLPVDRRRLA